MLSRGYCKLHTGNLQIVLLTNPLHFMDHECKQAKFVKQKNQLQVKTKFGLRPVYSGNRYLDKP